MKVASESAAVSSASNAVAWLVLAAAGVPLSVLYDFSFESTVGIDRFWALPHTLTYLSVALAGVIAGTLAIRGRFTKSVGVSLGLFHAPLGAWLVLWGALAFLAALVFDRWWQSAYGMGAGIWHPPQLTGHAVVRRSDGEVFTHLHPVGTISMAAQAVFARGEAGTNAFQLQVKTPVAENEVSFPYAFSRSGEYRVWVQVRTGGRVLTGVFDVTVKPER